MKTFFSLLLAVFLLISIDAYAKRMYVNSLQITPVDAPKSGANKLGFNVQRGTSVEQVEVQNSWSKIKVNNKEGWVPNIVLTDQVPMNKVSPLNNNDVDISKNARRRASGYTSAAAARGLTSSGRKRISTMQAPDYEALEKMEKGKADEKQAIDFINKKEEKTEKKENK